MPKTQITSFQEPCAKCKKKYGPELTNWEPCKNCEWVTKETPSEETLLKQKKNEKICLECQEALNFLEPEKGKYLCGKNKCLRAYIEKKSENNEK